MRVAVLGLGAMGQRLAQRLLINNHDVTVWNRSPAAARTLVDAGATLADSPRAAASNAALVIAMVRDDAASRRVWLAENDGALAGLPDTAIAVESSTLSIEWTTQLAGAFANKDRQFLDAPVVGSRPQAEAAKLIYLVGGEARAFAAAKSVLANLGSTIYHVGPVGSGTKIKLLVNALYGTQVALMAELLGLAKNQNLVCNQVVEILAAIPACSLAAKLAAENMVAENFAPQFPIELVEKDLAYLEMATVSTAIPVSTSARTVYQKAIAAGYGMENLTALIKLY